MIIGIIGYSSERKFRNKEIAVNCNPLKPLIKDLEYSPSRSEIKSKS